MVLSLVFIEAGGVQGVPSTLAPYWWANAALAVSVDQFSVGSMRTRHRERPICPLFLPNKVAAWALVIPTGSANALDAPKPSMVWKVELVLMAHVCACRLVWDTTSPTAAINPSVANSFVFMFAFPLLTVLAPQHSSGLDHWRGHKATSTTQPKVWQCEQMAKQ